MAYQQYLLISDKLRDRGYKNKGVCSKVYRVIKDKPKDICECRPIIFIKQLHDCYDNLRVYMVNERPTLQSKLYISSRSLLGKTNHK